MLKSFFVSNFKNFENKITLRLDQPSDYEFNSEIVADNCLTKGIIYGINGSGKSNLALALFDIVLHKKLEAMNCYQSQLSDFPNPRSLEAVVSLAKLRGSTMGAKSAEAFMLVRTYRK